MPDWCGLRGGQWGGDGVARRIASPGGRCGQSNAPRSGFARWPVAKPAREFGAAADFRLAFWRGVGQVSRRSAAGMRAASVAW